MCNKTTTDCTKNSIFASLSKSSLSFCVIVTLICCYFDLSLTKSAVSWHGCYTHTQGCFFRQPFFQKESSICNRRSKSFLECLWGVGTSPYSLSQYKVKELSFAYYE